MARHRGWLRKRLRLKLKKEALFSIVSVLFFSFALLVSLSFSQQGPFLSDLNRVIIIAFGWISVFVVFFLVIMGLIFTKINVPWNQAGVLVGGLLTSVSLSGLTKAGVVGQELFFQIASLITPIGAYLIFITASLVGIIVFFNTSFDQVFGLLGSIWSALSTSMKKIQLPKKKASFQLPLTPPRVNPAVEPAMARELLKPVGRNDQNDLASSLSIRLPGAQTGVWTYPPMSLLEDHAGKKAERGDIKGNAATIERTLDSFGISAHVAEVNYGPAVTQYAIEVALGTKLSKITGLSNDLALALAAPGGQIRIEAPIPGRSMVGIELPNRSAEGVTLKEILISEAMKSTKSKLAVPLGLDVSGKPKIADLTRMPHVLIAGQTGSGKSVLLNSWITSLLFRASPYELNMIMVDPKRVELTPYNNIPHLLSPVIHEADKVLGALEWATKEMDRRYKLFAGMGLRNIEAYHQAAGFQNLPYIVIIVDELADIMLFAPARVEESICRIAQMARATGIHLVIATQRPSVDVLTGLIKANIPCRISFAVSSLVDSRVIIDTPGAEKLLGKGDMLYVPPDQAKPTRIQGAYVSEGEINRLAQFLLATGVEPSYTEGVTNLATPLGGSSPRSVMGGNSDDGRDPSFADAVRIVVETRRASASLLQRKLSLGYARAARVIDQLEQAGVVGPGSGAKARDILVEDAETFLSNLSSQT